MPTNPFARGEPRQGRDTHEVLGIVKGGKVELPAWVRLPEGAEVRVIVSPEALVATQPFESEPVGEGSVLADIAWATGHRFDS